MTAKRFDCSTARKGVKSNRLAISKKAIMAIVTDPEVQKPLGSELS